MATPPQGLFAYAGIVGPISGQFTLTHGISPSRAVIYCAPQKSAVWKCGPFVLTYGTLTLTFKQCTADKISVVTDGSGHQRWAVHILDRRWKWKECGRISGYYNVRRGEDKIIKETEKTPRELATLCLEALGERNFNVSGLPTEPRPEVDWDYELPAEALARLCDAYGCRVTLKLNDTIAIERVGVGKPLPINDLVTDGEIEPDPPERPDSIVFVAGRTRYQADFELEAVGLDIDYSDPDHPGGVQVVKLIDELSYTPIVKGELTWKYSDPPFFEETEQQQGKADHEMAQASVFRWYRIKVPFTLPNLEGMLLDVDGEPAEGTTTVEEIERILPIEDNQIERRIVLAREEPLTAWIHGEYNGDLDSVDDMDDTLDPRNKVKAKYPGGFSIDASSAIVKFSQHVYSYETDADGNSVVVPAKLKLRTTISLRDKETRGWQHAAQRRKMPPPLCGTKPRYILRDDITYEIVYIYDDAGNVAQVETNETEVRQQADYYLDAAEREYQYTEPAAVGYAGFVAFDLDGAIQQITWSIDGEGYARTRATRNKEELLYTPSFKERRRIERAREAAKKEHATDRQRNKKHEKAQA